MIDLDTVISLEKRDRIATISVNRPEQRNAMTTAMWQRLGEHMRSLHDDPEIRVAIIRGAGNKAFLAGADISELRSWTTKEKHLEYVTILEEVFDAVEAYPYPVIAMITGPAFGAGCELAVACDLRLIQSTAKVGIPSARLGIMLNYSFTQRLVNLVGIANAKEILLTAGAFDAQRAYDMGLVNRVIAPEALEEETYRLAEQIAVNAPLALAGSKTAVARCTSHQQAISYADLDELEVASFESEDVAEGLQAFVDKRPPVFKGR